jgi:glycosyltransferase involved in cell wall biosynthesis
MRVTFVLPGFGTVPIGGFKIVYEYASRLSRRGHLVTVVHPCRMLSRRQLLAYIGCWRECRRARQVGKHRPDWFRLEPHVRTLATPTPTALYIPRGDVVIATGWQTAPYVARYPDSKGHQFYFIQHLETWCGPEEEVVGTWKLRLHKIVIARWLQAFAREIGEDATYIPNAFDPDEFGIDVPRHDRHPATVGMLYHGADWKGSRDGLAALALAKGLVPALRAEVFGVSGPPPGLPDWITYHQRPVGRELRRLYNGIAVFVAPSWTEGYPLPPAEAALCGAALAVTDCGGHREYSVPSRTALLSPIKDPRSLAENIVALIKDDALRLRLATEAERFLRQRTWDHAVDALERCLKQPGDFSPVYPAPAGDGGHTLDLPI